MKNRRKGVLSVILVNFRGTDDTLTAISELTAVDWPADRLEIIVVENGSGDDSAERLKAAETPAKIIVSQKNLGFTGGCNLGFSKSTGEVIAFLNNDARPDKQWIRAAMRTLDENPQVGAVASKVLDWEGVNVDFTDAALTWYGMGYKPQAGQPDTGKWEEEKDVLFGTGAAMFVRAAAFDQLGGFDDRYFMFYDDVDLGWRLNLLGWLVRYQPKSIAFHKHHASMKAFGEFREAYLLERNALYTLYKNLDDESLAQVFPGALALAVRRSVAKGDVDTTSLDLRVPGNDDEPMMQVPKDTMAGIFAIDQLVEHLPSLTNTRREIQASRVRSDRELRRLFGETDQPAYPIERYLQGYDKITASLDVFNTESRRRILIVTGDPIGEKMAGPAIRVVNIARLLGEEHDVRVVSTTKSSSTDPLFSVFTVSHRSPSDIKEHEEWADVMIVQGHALALFPILEKSKKIKVVDIYDPLHLEQLEQGREKSIGEWDRQVLDANDDLNHQLSLGDFFLCASERQRFFWLGQLAAVGRVNALNYRRNDELDELIAVAPFGLSSTEPVHTRPALKGVVPGIEADDKVIIWGGGLYSWFDPITLIRAVGALAERRPNVKLFFMGVQHPNPNVPLMDIVTESRRVSDALGLTGRHVFFNSTWVPYDDRQNYLLEADAGVSTHFQHLETTFSFRTRILDYLWGGLPIVTTAGDSFAELVEREQLGAVVPERDTVALTDALERVLFDDTLRAEARANVARVRESFVWEKAMAPLVEFCRNPQFAADHVDGLATRRPGTDALGKVRIRRRGRPYGAVHAVRMTVFHFQQGGVESVMQKIRERNERKRLMSKK